MLNQCGIGLFRCRARWKERSSCEYLPVKIGTLETKDDGCLPLLSNKNVLFHQVLDLDSFLVNQYSKVEQQFSRFCFLRRSQELVPRSFDATSSSWNAVYTSIPSYLITCWTFFFNFSFLICIINASFDSFFVSTLSSDNVLSQLQSQFPTTAQVLLATPYIGSGVGFFLKERFILARWRTVQSPTQI